MPHLVIPAMPFGFPELAIIFLLVVVLFGATRLPQIGKGLGEGIKNFRKGLKGEDGPEHLEEAKSDSKPR